MARFQKWAMLAQLRSEAALSGGSPHVDPAPAGNDSMPHQQARPYACVQIQCNASWGYGARPRQTDAGRAGPVRREVAISGGSTHTAVSEAAPLPWGSSRQGCATHPDMMQAPCGARSRV